MVLVQTDLVRIFLLFFNNYCNNMKYAKKTDLLSKLRSAVITKRTAVIALYCNKCGCCHIVLSPQGSLLRKELLQPNGLLSISFVFFSLFCLIVSFFFSI
jgi:hypothetical protein